MPQGGRVRRDRKLVAARRGRYYETKPISRSGATKKRSQSLRRALLRNEANFQVGLY